MPVECFIYRGDWETDIDEAKCEWMIEFGSNYLKDYLSE